MGKNKLQRFEAVKKFSNFFQPEFQKDFFLKGKWKSDYFKNNGQIILELGCGKGEYTVELAQQFPDKNFIGIDIKGSRMFVGALKAIELNLKNVAFCRTKIDFINNCFAENEIDEIWLTFSDPQPKKPNKRLTSNIFLEKYKKLLNKNGIINLKTDSDCLFEFTKEQIIENNLKCLAITNNLYGEFYNSASEQDKIIFDIKTHYENLFALKGHKIKYCKFLLN
jgi:tRNA (guanine-N7-)-methyltransferase